MEIILTAALLALVLVSAVATSIQTGTTRHHHGPTVAQIQARIAAESSRTYVPLGRGC
ncbi:hypothetical protein [Nocardia sp. IFM 10818]